MLFSHQIARGTNTTAVSDSDCDKVEIFHSESRIVEPEKQEPTTWIIEYRVPIGILEKYCPVIKPAPEVIWRANFYRCGGKTDDQYACWNNIVTPQPDYHRPEQFGELLFA